MQTFKEIGLRPELLTSIEEMGFVNPTPIQKLAIPQVMESKNDLIAYAQTGTGKTAAFSLPILHQINPHEEGIKCIILGPTRELGMQIANDIKSYAKHFDKLKVVPVYGGAGIESQIKDLQRGCDIVVGTPGRTLDLINRKKLNLANVQWLVLDEADEMLSMGFADDMDAILATTPADKQTLLFSATMPPEMLKLAKKYMHNPIELSAGSKQESNLNVHHIYYRINSRDRYSALKRAVDVNPDIYGIIFCRTRSETKNVAEKLAADGYNTDALHGDLSQAQRDYVMNRFRNRQLQLLIATDVAARGLDVQELTHVINYNLPDEDEVYIHRSGRTGRAENVGVSIVLVTGKEESRLRYIEKKIGRKFDRMPIPGGKEICENQLFHLIDNIINTEIVDNQIDRFLPQVYELFDSMTKEDLIRKVVSVEFNRFLEYYRNAPDLNKEDDKSDRKGRDRDRDRDRGESSGSERRFKDRDVEFTRFFINQGQKDGFNPKTLMGLINQNMDGKSPEIGQIEIMKMFSFFELESKYSKDLMKSMKSVQFKGRAISIEESRPKKGGSGGGGGGAGRRRRRK